MDRAKTAYEAQRAKWTGLFNKMGDHPTLAYVLHEGAAQMNVDNLDLLHERVHRLQQRAESLAERMSGAADSVSSSSWSCCRSCDSVAAAARTSSSYLHASRRQQIAGARAALTQSTESTRARPPPSPRL